MKLVSSTQTKTVYESFGYKITVRKMFDDMPPTITIENEGMDKLLKPSFITDGNELTIDYSKMQLQSIEKGYKFDWVDDVNGFIDDFYTNLDKIKERT